MTKYRRAHVPGATWFFTVNLAERKGNRLLVEKIDVLRTAFKTVRARHPFRMDAVAILPDHLHCILTLPPDDMDFSTRWGLIKGYFSRAVEKGERVSSSRAKRGERGIWQRRFWEHLIRDQDDFNRHADYIHWNPIKHGWVHSSFHEYVRHGVYPANWGGEGMTDPGEANDAIDAVRFAHQHPTDLWPKKAHTLALNDGSLKLPFFSRQPWMSS